MSLTRISQKIISNTIKGRGSFLAHRFNPQVCTAYTYTNRKFPELLYFPHVFRWIAAKIKFYYLKNSWDPEFSEGAFIYGSVRAICKVTEVISNGEQKYLKNLLTDYAAMSVRSDMDVKLTNTQKEIIRLRPHDIKLLVPVKVQLIRDKQNKKYCFILLKSLSMKWYEGSNGVKLVLIVLETQFQRDYTTGVKPEWIISIFNIVQCALIGGSTAMN